MAARISARKMRKKRLTDQLSLIWGDVKDLIIVRDRDIVRRSKREE